MLLHREALGTATLEVSIMKALLRMSGWLTLVVLAANPASSAPLGTGFSYQGQLNQSGSPVNGNTHLRFSLWDAAGSGQPPVGGNQIGASQIVANLTVTNGLFTVQLNSGGEFGLNAFNGDARWLQVEVCADAGCGTVTILSPRQPVSATPYALHSAGPWQSSGGNLSFSGGNVGIGTSSPSEELHVGGDILCDRLTWNGTTSALDNDQGGAIELGNSLGIGNSPYIDFHRGVGAPEDFNVRLQNNSSGQLSVVGNLHVIGNVTREYTAGTADLAAPIAYGTISSAGGVLSGTPNVTSGVAANVYSITIAGESYASSSYVTAVTVIAPSAARFATASASGGELQVRVFDLTGALVPNTFSFVTYKP